MSRKPGKRKLVPIWYRNTDLDLHAPFPLEPLVSALQPGGLFALHITLGQDGLWYCVVETDGPPLETPEATIAQMLDAIERLGGDAREHWSSCTLREFNIGYDCGDEPWAFNKGLTNDTLARMAKAGASLLSLVAPMPHCAWFQLRRIDTPVT